MVQSFQDLIIWQKAMDLVIEVYNLVKELPKEEQYALSDQMRRAAVSIPSNIAEGQSRNSTKEFIQFLSVAKGSNAELQIQLSICVRLQYLKEDQVSNTLSISYEVGKMLNTIISKLSPNP